ncbi:MAG: hypothetical protein LOD85_04295 [Clostridia bacterium]|nr:hypothetical protein [Bacillota bacterium]MBO2521831.1 hypothetical protein [Bacillota bacterium]
MSLLGDVLKKMTSAAAELGDAVVNGLGDLAESVTGENAITRAARHAGNTAVRGMKEIADAAIDVGEAIIDTVFGCGEEEEAAGRERGGPKAPDFVEPAGAE